MRTELVMPYPEMVEKLFKKDTMPMMLMHVGVGIVGEIIELGERNANWLEELGDIAFYIQAGLNFNNLTLEQFEYAPRELDHHLLVEAGEVMDCGKRHLVYGKPFEQERFNRHLQNAAICFHARMRSYGLTLLEVQLANQEKLLTGEKARYALGVYSDEQANARADKTGTGG